MSVYILKPAMPKYAKLIDTIPYRLDISLRAPGVSLFVDYCTREYERGVLPETASTTHKENQARTFSHTKRKTYLSFQDQTYGILSSAMRKEKEDNDTSEGEETEEEVADGQDKSIFHQFFAPGSLDTSVSSDDQSEDSRLTSSSGDSGASSCSSSVLRFDRDLRAKHRAACKQMTVRQRGLLSRFGTSNRWLTLYYLLFSHLEWKACQSDQNV